MAAAAGVLSLFSLPAALACYGMLGWLALRKHGWLGLAGATVASLALFVAISYPWALRNEAVFGEKGPAIGNGEQRRAEGDDMRALVFQAQSWSGFFSLLWPRSIF
jgi:hypothetical protein